MSTSINMRKPSDLYTIKWSPNDRVLFFALTGFWNDDDFAAFSDALAFAAANAAGEPFDTLADLSALPAQSQAVVALHSKMIASFATTQIRYQVIVGAGPLLTMQVKRATALIMPFFARDRAEAERWLRDRRKNG